MSEHRRLDINTILQHLTRPLQIQQYLKILQLLYGFYSPLENELLNHIHIPILDNVSNQNTAWKSDRLAQDIIAISADGLHEIEFCQRLPTMTCSGEVLGILYVVEGSTLGGQFIYALLHKNPSTVNYPKSFFRGYGDHTRIRWNSFCNVLNEYGQNHPEETDIVINSAKDTFHKLTDWLELRQHDL